jgi:predicted KAP-like P-loop ATPase
MSVETDKNGPKQMASYISNQPITTFSADRLNRLSFAKSLATTISSREDPSCLVVSLYARWGEGKTSLLNLVAEVLSTSPRIVIVRFNPWFIRSEAELIPALFKELAEAVEKKMPTAGKKIGAALETIGDFLSIAESVPLIRSFARGSRFIGKRLAQTTMDDQRNRIKKILQEVGARVVVLIDDIDRLAKEELQALFRTIRLAADFDRVTYLLAFDRDVVSSALAEQYGPDLEHGKAFLEKIVQVPLFLPPANRATLRQLVAEQIDAALVNAEIRLSEDQSEELSVPITIGLEPLFKTPRQAILYGNALLFALPILRGEVNIIDQILLEGMRIFHPLLYERVRTNPQFVLGTRFVFPDAEKQNEEEELAAFLDSATRGATPREARAARDLLLHLFPRLDGHHGYGYDEKWAKEQRLCSERYFDRYFCYTVDPTDVSDVELDRFVSLIESGVNDAVTLLRAFVSGGRGRLTLEKLTQRAREISSGHSGALALAIARCGEEFPLNDFDAWLPGPSAADLAALLIRKLVSNINHSRRTAARIGLIQAAQPLVFAGTLFAILTGKRDEPESINMTEEEKHELQSLLVDRIRSELRSRWFFTTGWGDDYLLDVWRRSNPSEVRQYLYAHLSSDYSKVVQVLLTFAPRSTGRRPKYALHQESYQLLEEFVTPSLVAEKVWEVLIAKPTNLETSEKELLEKFIALHKSIANKNDPTAGAQK